jgi:hypothetical protein
MENKIQKNTYDVVYSSIIPPILTELFSSIPNRMEVGRPTIEGPYWKTLNSSNSIHSPKV